MSWDYVAPDPVDPARLMPGQTVFANVYPDAQAPERPVGLFWASRVDAKRSAFGKPGYRLKIKARAWLRAGKWESMS